MNTTFFLNGQQSKVRPLNYRELQVTFDFVGENRGISAEFDRLVFRDNGESNEVEKILQWRQNNGFGVGMPFKIKAGNFDLPDLMLDFSDNFKKIGLNEVEVSVKAVNQKDWFKSVASSLQFKRLEEMGIISQSDATQVAYNINYIPDHIQTVILTLAIYNTSKALVEFVKETAETITEVNTSLIPTIGIPPQITAGAIIQAIVKIAIRLAYFIALALTLKNLIKDLLENIYSKTRYHTGISVWKLFEKGCYFLGLTFESSINTGKWKDLVIISSKTERGKFNINQLNGITPKREDAGIYFFGEFVETMMRMFNADYKIINGVFRFERWDWWQNQAVVTLKSNYTNQSNLLNEYEDNADEFKAGYLISFATDTSDRNTLDHYEGTCLDVVTENSQNGGLGQKYNTLKGNEIIDLPLALGTRKDKLNAFEKILKALCTAVDKVCNAFGGNSSLAATITARMGNLQLSDHFNQVPKLLLVKSNHLLPNQRQHLNAKSLWNDFHYINSFVTLGGVTNQWLRVKIPQKIESSKAIQILNNNFCKLDTGEVVEVERMTWTFSEDYAEIFYRVNKKYNENLKQTLILSQNTTSETNG